ncbi:AraC family transcriptional regulator [Streptomyces griseorubiginosus]|uniref:AraC family transcriptional regulator n=1 Tax=Streptomyces griseorubiginosus TaxID=67304 RepID=UPI001AD6DA87|nr:AraC family transcriptional regulator [Streptomyces griseorubiginosus]MBO4256202.1 helix-turn-helix domain-containing protein [Streptomyces griseorubiginosus]
MEETVGEPAVAGVPLLRRFTVFEAAGIDEVRPRVAQLLSSFRPTAGGGSGMLCDLSAVGFGPFSLIYARTYGDEFAVELTEQVSYYDVNFALFGTNQVDTDEERLVLTQQSGCILSPGMGAKMQVSDGYRQLHLRIERFALERCLEQMLGRHVVGPVRFRTGMDLTVPALASWARGIRLFVRDLDEVSGLSAFGPELSPWASFVMTGLLLAQPHDHSAQLAQRLAAPARPPSVKRVVELIERDPGGDLSLARLSAVSGVGPRSLQRSFRRHTGVSPREYIQSVRLARAHEDLVAGAGATVADIALRWGFNHVPRFAHAYKERYGVPPSTTLRASQAEMMTLKDRFRS